jgi:microcystin-dependent protein
MALPYVGEIRMFAGNFAPAGWMDCDGQLLPISGNETLFQLIGTTYGGDGQSTFALPDLRGRVPVHVGAGIVLGEQAGVESVTLTAQQIPAHTHGHSASASPASTTGNPTGLTADAGTTLIYGADAPSIPLNAAAISTVGGSQPHDNMAPFLAVSYIISMFGIFPSPN